MDYLLIIKKYLSKHKNDPIPLQKQEENKVNKIEKNNTKNNFVDFTKIKFINEILNTHKSNKCKPTST